MYQLTAKELKLKTALGSKTTRIVFGRGFALEKSLVELLDRSQLQVAMITDHNLEKLYGDKIQHLDVKMLAFQPGEAGKTRKTKEVLEDHLLSHNFGRDCLLIALGGGCVGDVASFLASTYCRGVPIIHIPTSLIAMVDASIGGKSGVNTPYGKNMIGTFFAPDEVWIDLAFLETLPHPHWTGGLVEMVKAGLAASQSLFHALRSWNCKDLSKDPAFLLDRIFESVAIKRDIVELDPHEDQGIRRVLNLGHTFGHALEVMEGFTLKHGNAVAMGILASCFVSCQLGYLHPKQLDDIRGLFETFSIDLCYFKEHSSNEWMSQLARDKKAVQGTPRIVMIDTIGHVIPFQGQYCDAVAPSILEQTFNWMHEQFYRPR